jgi:hypothetical protein
LPWMALGTVRFATHPRYTFLEAARGFENAIAAEPDAHRLIVGNQGDEISLWTGIPAICAEYSVDTPKDLLERYDPGWYVEILRGKQTPMRQQIESTCSTGCCHAESI